jgi:hypothetical protein
MPTETETGTPWVQDIIVDPIRMAGQQIGEQLGSIILPLLGVLLIVLPIGYFVAKLVESLVVKVLQTLAVDKVADQVQLSTMLSKGGIRQKLSELVGMIVYWLIMLAVVMIAFNALQLTVAAELFQTVVAYLPNVLAAVFILIIGIFAAAFLSATVRTAASNAGILQAHLLGQLTQIVVVIFATVAALEQLNVRFFGEIFLILLGGFSLGCAIAFGLGCKDMAGRWVNELSDGMQGKKR